ncbi:hypothetical protein NFJ02_32g82040 [Pycnococcus provasolii]
MASKSATTLASSPPKPSTVAPTSVWSLLGEQGFEASAFSSFFEPSVAEGKESIELPKGCGAHLLYGVAPHELSTAVQAYSELLSLKLAYHQPEEESVPQPNPKPAQKPDNLSSLSVHARTRELTAARRAGAAKQRKNAVQHIEGVFVFDVGRDARLLLGQRPHAGAAYFQKPREAA